MNKSGAALISDEMSERIIEVACEIVMTDGADSLTVRSILRRLEISNRVFYNRFHNIDEVRDIVYHRTVVKIRECFPTNIDPDIDFFEFVTDLVSRSLLFSYEIKKQFNQYYFESDSHSETNREWWTVEIRKLIEYAMESKLIKEVDSDMLAYAIWCFCKGYNADAVSRDLPKEEAVEGFKYSFRFLLEGLRRRTE